MPHSRGRTHGDLRPAPPATPQDRVFRLAEAVIQLSSWSSVCWSSLGTVWICFGPAATSVLCPRQIHMGPRWPLSSGTVVDEQPLLVIPGVGGVWTWLLCPQLHWAFFCFFSAPKDIFGTSCAPCLGCSPSRSCHSGLNLNVTASGTPVIALAFL